MAMFSIYLHMQIKCKTHTVNKVIKSKIGGIQKLKHRAIIPFLFHSIVTLSALKKLLLASAD